jgi:hypothetical protein
VRLALLLPLLLKKLLLPSLSLLPSLPLLSLPPSLLLSLLPSLPPLPKARLQLQLNQVSVWHLPQNQKYL